MQYSREERHALERALQQGNDPMCPGCGARVSVHPVPTPPEVSYVRHRIWIVCPQCKRSAALDVKKATQ